jgi:hypothetical protein
MNDTCLSQLYHAGVNIFNFPASSITGPALFLKKLEKLFFCPLFSKNGSNVLRTQLFILRVQLLYF